LIFSSEEVFNFPVAAIFSSGVPDCNVLTVASSAPGKDSLLIS